MPNVTNVYLEHMVKREDKTAQILKKIAMIVLAVLVNGFILLHPVLILFISLSATITFFAFFIFWGRISREYEYIYTDGLLDIDVIYGRANRKRLLSVDARKFQFMAPYDCAQYRTRIDAKYDKNIDATRGTITDRTYCGVVTRDDGKTYKLLFEPSDEILEAMRHYIPNKFVAKR